MDLLKFYIDSIFGFLTFPNSQDICSDKSDIRNFCLYVSSFVVYLPIFLVVITILSSVKPKIFGKVLLLSIICFVSSFFYADKILDRLSDPFSFGYETYIILFYSWCFLFTVFFLISLLFRRSVNNVFLIFLPITIFLSFAFVYYGRGSFEQATSLLGGSFIDISAKSVLKSNLIHLFLFSLIFTSFYGVLLLVIEWVKSGKMDSKLFFDGFRVFSLFVVINIVPLISIPFGALKNSEDIKEVKTFIDEIAKKAQKYNYENGEYPKIIDEYIDEPRTPFLLKRHEYFTYGIKGTYYFSRPDKFCFLFQNPAQNFGYYSLTSSREWRFSPSFRSYDDVYINMCDETLEGAEQLISGHLGMETPDDIDNALRIQYNAPNIKPETNEASEKLHEKIMEYGKENPEIFRYYGNRPKNYKELIKEKYGF